MKNSPIILLDEATSSLDAESEEKIQNAVLNLIKNKTTMVIAHRLSTIRGADIIYVLENGSIKEYGNHNDLLDMNGTYKKLWDVQTGTRVQN